MANLISRSNPAYRKNRSVNPKISANTQMDNDVTPVYLAAQEGHLEVLKFLVLEAGGSLYVRAKDGMAPLHAASQMGCLNCVKWMIQDQGVDPNLRDSDGATPLHFAASRGHLETVRWLLRHGARLSLDKYGKSPINDAAENQQVECLNALVQHGATPDYNEADRINNNASAKQQHACSCLRKTHDTNNRNSYSSDCSNCMKEPFYLHPPSLTTTQRPNSLEAPHAPQDGLYINPMNNHRHSASSCSGSSSGDSVNGGDSFYLHDPQELMYNRVKDLFENTTHRPAHAPMSALTVKVEVHSSSSGAGSDENLSSSDLSERSGEHEHDYEDIYLARDPKSKEKSCNAIRSRSRDSGSHSRSGSASSNNSTCNVILNKDEKKDHKYSDNKHEGLKNTKTADTTQGKGIHSNSEGISEEENGKKKLEIRHSLQPQKNTNNRILKRVVSVPSNMCPPPPPPLPPMNNEEKVEEMEEIVVDGSVKMSDVTKGVGRNTNGMSGTIRFNSSCSDLTIISLNTDAEDSDKNGPNLVNKQRVLPFIPPSFPGSTDSNHLIKPSEYLRSITDKRSGSSVQKNQDCEESTIVTEEKKEENSVICSGPPPPPLPGLMIDQPTTNGLKFPESNTDTARKQQQPLSAISIQDLNSVQLRRTDKMIASKTFSAPTRSLSLQCLQSENYLAQKTDLIAELKMSKDITGIRKMKVERAKTEELQEKEIFTEITKQFTITSFVEKQTSQTAHTVCMQIPDRDNTGNIIPAWKRQMMAKKAAERAKRELEDKLQKEAEEKRLQAIPQWKRQLLAKKEETEYKIKSTLYTPKVEETKPIKIHDSEDCWRQHNQDLPTKVEKYNNDINKENKSSTPVTVTVADSADKFDDNQQKEDQNIIPWRAQLRKTNSKLNLLD